MRLKGIGFDGSAIEGFSRVSEADTVARPDPSTFQVLPWTTSDGRHHSARMFCDIVMPDGTPSWADSRNVLRRQMDKAAEKGSAALRTPSASSSSRRTRRPMAHGARASRSGRLLRPDRAQRGAQLPAPRHRRARVGGRLCRVLPTTRVRRGSRDRPALRRRAVDGRQRDDVPLPHQGGGHQRRRFRDLHAQAVQRPRRIGDAPT